MTRHTVMLFVLLAGLIVTVSITAAQSNMTLSSQVSELRMSLAWAQRRIPICPEDSVLVGAGAFNSAYHEGQWEAYQCGPALDDYETD